MKFLSTLLVAVVALGGCAYHDFDPHPFDGRGFHPDTSGYRLDYVDPARFSLVSPDWRIDNYRIDERTEEPRRRQSRQRTDLILHHRTNAGVIFISAPELGPRDATTDLRVLAESYVGSIASNGYMSNGYMLASIAPTGRVEVRERRYAAEMLDRHDLAVAGQPAHAVLIDVANLNQTEVAPEERQARAIVVFARAPRTRVHEIGNVHTEEPLVLIVGYANTPADFESGMDDFRSLLRGIRFDPAR